MHKILLGLLTPDTTIHIFHEGFNEALQVMKLAYAEITIKNKFAAARMHVDLESFIQLLTELEFPESIRSPISSKLRQLLQQQAG